MQPDEIVEFWVKAGPKRWFAKSDAFDAEIRERFQAAHHAAARGELDGWDETATGALALLLLLDQFPRNIWRDSPHAFATDPLAREAAEAAIERGFDVAVAPALRQFFYLPLEHSEDLGDQERAVALAAASGDEHLLKWAKIHRDIIRRFGRFPHRNDILGRTSTTAERAFLSRPGSHF
jgi:uncharacterized protein (DUF924 family)